MQMPAIGGLTTERERISHDQPQAQQFALLSHLPTRLRQYPVVLGAAAGALCCVLALAVSLLLKGSPPTARSYADTVCTDLKSRRYDLLYSLLTPSLQSLGNASQFSASQQQLDALRGTTTNCSVSTVQSGPSQTVVTLTVARERMAEVSTQIILVPAQNGWALEQFDSRVV